MKKEKIVSTNGTLPATKKRHRNVEDSVTKVSDSPRDSVATSENTSIGRRADASNKKLNVIRIEDNSTNSEIKTEENSQNVIFLTNTNSRNIKLVCGKNSKTKYIEINNSKNKTEIKREINLEKDSELNFYNIYAGSGNQSSETITELKENSSLFVKNIFLSHKQEHSHDLKVIHKEKNSKSNLQSRGVLSDSKINLRGLIKIEQNAEESEGYQKSDILILKDSEAVSIPDLEIHNNKVKCSHGSSISRLDKEKIFYLQTRGLSEKDAKSVLINAFFSNTFQELEPQEAEQLENITKNKLLLMAK